MGVIIELYLHDLLGHIFEAVFEKWSNTLFPADLLWEFP